MCNHLADFRDNFGCPAGVAAEDQGVLVVRVKHISRKIEMKYRAAYMKFSLDSLGDRDELFFRDANGNGERNHFTFARWYQIAKMVDGDLEQSFSAVDVGYQRIR
jgi:hypothetical protein